MVFHDHKGHAEKCVGTCCINCKKLVCILEGKLYKCACGLTDPVLLLHLDIGKIINSIKALEELIGILCDTEIPNVLGLLNDI